MIFRELNVSDIDIYRKDLIELIQICFFDTYDRYADDELVNTKVDNLKVYIHEKKAYVLGAVTDNELIGFLWAYPVETPFETVLHIAYISTKAGHRGKGIGGHLISAIEKKAGEMHFEHIELIVGAYNSGAIKFYSKHDYEHDRYVLRKFIPPEYH